MSLFNFDEPMLLSFFAVLVRYSVLIAVLPITGDKAVPGPAKVLMAFTATVAIFPALMSSGQIRPGDALIWGSSAAGIARTVGLEAMFGLVLGYVARLAFDAISLGSNLVGGFMGFAMASAYDPHQETQTQVVAEIQMAIAMLVFLVLDGHHTMLRASLASYDVVGLGQAGFGDVLGRRLTEITGMVISFGLQLAAPVAISIFAVNVAFGVMAKAMPQMNILVLSFGVTALVGLIVMFLGIPEFQGASAEILSHMSGWMEAAKKAMGGR
jgi:flagellar biosynthesis protein FliR